MRKIYLIFLILSLISCKTTQETAPEITQETTQITAKETTISETTKSIFPKSVGVVNDFDKIFTDEQKHKLKNLIINYEKETTNEIIIVSVKSIKPYNDIAKYTADLANYWGIGKKGKNNGLIIVFSKELKKIRIGTGYGTEKILTDEKCQEIIDNIILPEFKKELYFDGILIGINKLITEWKETN